MNMMLNNQMIRNYEPTLLNEKNFNEHVLKAKKPLIIQFSASGCKPCQELTPLLVEVVKQHEDKVELIKIDVEECPSLSHYCDVNQIPTVYTLIGTDARERFQGLQPLSALQGFVERLIETAEKEGFYDQDAENETKVEEEVEEDVVFQEVEVKEESTENKEDNQQDTTMIKNYEPTLLNEKNFNEHVLKAKKPLVVQFSANWCKPCQELTPLLVEVAKQYEDKVELIKIDVDESPSLSQICNVNQIPTVLTLIGNDARERFQGLQPLSALHGLFERLIETAEKEGFYNQTKAEDSEEGEKKSTENKESNNLQGIPINKVTDKEIGDQATIEAEEAEFQQKSVRELINMAETYIEEKACFKANRILHHVMTLESDQVPKFHARIFAYQARLALYLYGNLDEAKALLKKVPGSGYDEYPDLLDKLQSEIKLAELVVKTANEDSLMAQGMKAYRDGDMEQMAESLLKEMKEKKGSDARIGMIEMFKVLGEASPITKTYRPKLASVLY